MCVLASLDESKVDDEIDMVVVCEETLHVGESAVRFFGCADMTKKRDDERTSCR